MSPSFLCKSAVLAVLIGLFGFGVGANPAQAGEDPAATAVHMLGYIGVDYPATVAQGQVRNAAEYAEQHEFATRVRDLIATLPAVPEKNSLHKQAVQLLALIEAKADGKRVADLAERTRERLLQAYNIAVAPLQAPNLALGASLYAARCSACHGQEGRGDGPSAKGLSPAPANFHDQARQSQRSVYTLFNAITLGVHGTAMQAYGQTLSDDQRWALAFHVSNFLASDDTRHAGAALWSNDRYHSAFPNLRSVTSLSPQQASSQLGPDGPQVLAWLRSDPQQVMPKVSPLGLSARLLDQSLERYREGQFDQAYELAVSAYLEGFELVETGLAVVKPEMKQQVEKEMFAYRGLIKARAPQAELATKRKQIQGLLDEAGMLLDGAALSPSVAYTSSLVILLREGLEAILLLAVIVAFLIKTGRRDALKYIHFGWILALLLGGVTWAVATYMVDISGASREFTEGITALLAAAILLYVGFWLHNKLQAQRWKEFIETKVHGALNDGALWSISLVAFIAVYREVFETVLFYQTLWLQAGSAGQHMVFAGFLSAAAGLVVLSWLIFKFSVRLPLRLFFAVNSAFMYLLAVVFAGKGVAALQAADKLPLSSVHFPTIDVLGVHPSLQGLGLQGFLILAAALFVLLNRRKANT